MPPAAVWTPPNEAEPPAPSVADAVAMGASASGVAVAVDAAATKQQQVKLGHGEQVTQDVQLSQESVI